MVFERLASQYPRISRLLIERLRVPQLKRSVVTARYNSVPVGAEGHARHTSSVSHESPDFLSAFGVPQLERSVEATRDDSARIRTEGHARYDICVSFEYAEFMAGFRVPQLERVV